MTAPKGWKLVPEIATDEMAEAGREYGDDFGQGVRHRIYKEMIAAAPQAPLAVVPLVDDVYDKLSEQALTRTSPENIVDVLHALISTELRAAPHDGSLKVWFGPRPESNGRHNYTAILHRGDLSKGHTIDRSEFPERTRYHADCVRWLLGDLDKEPFILDYDAAKHSGYKESPEYERARFDNWFRTLPKDEEGFALINGVRANEGMMWDVWKVRSGL